MSGIDVLSPEWDKNPFPIYEVLREKYPVYHNESTDSYLLSRLEDIRQGFRNPALTSEHYATQVAPAVGGRTIVTMEGREHSTHRALITPAFKGTELTEKYVPMIHAQARELIDTFRTKGQVDLVGEFSTHFPISVIRGMMDLPAEDHEKFHRWYTTMLAFMENFAGDQDVIDRTLVHRDEMDEYFYPLIEERTARPGDDLLSAFCSSEIDGTRMTRDHVKAFVAMLMLAGGETTDKATANLFVNLLERPELMGAVRSDRTLVPALIAETMRYSPSIHIILRQTSERVEFSGGSIPAGGTVMLLLASGNRDPRAFSNPDEFDIHRDDLDIQKAFSGSAEHVGFGYGRHFCIGSVLARIEIEVAVNALLDAMEDIEPDGPIPGPTGLVSRAPASLPLRFTPAG